jgi:small ligand-binding sensory domain FIST
VEGIVVTEKLEPGTRIQFHVRDAETASADLQVKCKRVQTNVGVPFASLLFSCKERGKRMFGIPNHDANTFDQYFPNAPLGGFFAAGEFGPVGISSHVHGFTATAALLFPTT